LPIALQKRLDRAITNKINAKITSSKTRPLKDITNIVKKELINFEIEGKWRQNFHLIACKLNAFSLIVESLKLKSDHPIIISINKDPGIEDLQHRNPGSEKMFR
jgi:hypothetical protein